MTDVNPTAKLIFYRWLECSPDERDLFLDQSCGTDVELRREVEALLATHTNPESFFPKPIELHPQSTDTTFTVSVDPVPSSHSEQQATWDDGGRMVSGVLGPPQQPGDIGQLGHYRITGVLGTGGMGVVFEARDEQLKRKVAIKLMKPNDGNTPVAKARFLREAAAMAAMEHDHIITVHHVGEELEARLKRGAKFTIPQILQIGREVAQGLAAAHKQGLVHRDIKPSNLWLEADPENRIKILDFGLARSVTTAVDKAYGQITKTGVILGTPAYMAPEQARGDSVDHRCDLFSLGCVLYQLCTAEQPFKGKDTLSLLMSLAMDNPSPPHRLNWQVPEELSNLVLKLMAKDPAQRVQSVQEVIDVIRGLETECSTEEMLVQPIPRGKKALSVPKESADSTAELNANRPSRPKSLQVWAILGLLGVVLGLLVYFFGLRAMHFFADRGTIVIDTHGRNVRTTVFDGAINLTAPKERPDEPPPGKEAYVVDAGYHKIKVVVNDEYGDERSFTKEFTLPPGGLKVIDVVEELQR
ncbi:MAG: serine/threonine-protein kinase [Gemmataceae bacterium]